jgi:UTP--glucose-1-phosphate uridylyltransferase
MDPDLAPLLTADQRDILDRYGFDEARFAEHRARLAAGGPAAWDNTIKGDLRPPAPGDVAPLPPRGSADRKTLEDVGLEAISKGRIASVVLNGGMATRFGGVVKAAVDALPGRSFLDLKLADARATERRANGRVPVWLMNSFATDPATKELLAALGATTVGTFVQFVAVRLTPEGGVFVEDDGHASLYAPGHGDLTEAMARGPMAALRAAGVQAFVMSNVDNLAAGVDPAIVGRHLQSGAQMTVEVVRKQRDKGGAPALVNGRLEIVESFRFPQGFDEDTIPVFNTNTFVLDLAAVDRPFALDWFAVQKKVDGRPAIQLERLAGQLSAFLTTRAVEVARTGPEGRFLPAKDPEELASRRADIEAVLGARGALSRE